MTQTAVDTSGSRVRAALLALLLPLLPVAAQGPASAPRELVVGVDQAYPP